MIDNAILHHIMKKNVWYINKILKFWVKRSFRSRILGKTPVWNEQILASCEKCFPFFNDLQMFHLGSNSIKDLSKSLFKKKKSQFSKKNVGFEPSPPSHNFFFKIYIYYPILIKFCMIVSWKLGLNWFFLQIGSPSPLT